MKNGGTVCFSTEVVQQPREGVDDVQGFRLPALPPGSYLAVAISDSGAGISDEVKERLFEPFFTTKPIGEGTGMGLASVYGTVKSHQGGITVESQLGRGTTFCIYLPLSDIVPREESAIRAARASQTGLRVLVVDDESPLRELLRESLREAGHKVTLAASGEEAARLYAEHFREIDLVILDLMMPGQAGPETFDQLKQIRADVRVLLSSGFGAEGDVERLVAQGARGYLPKPYQQRQLHAAIALAMRTDSGEQSVVRSAS
jgi:CheY-like chemotaxis protein